MISGVSVGCIAPLCRIFLSFGRSYAIAARRWWKIRRCIRTIGIKLAKATIVLANLDARRVGDLPLRMKPKVRQIDTLLL
jgi:hypothetical protein